MPNIKNTEISFGDKSLQAQVFSKNNRRWSTSVPSSDSFQNSAKPFAPHKVDSSFSSLSFSVSPHTGIAFNVSTTKFPALKEKQLSAALPGKATTTGNIKWLKIGKHASVFALFSSLGGLGIEFVVAFQSLNQPTSPTQGCILLVFMMLAFFSAAGFIHADTLLGESISANRTDFVFSGWFNDAFNTICSKLDHIESFYPFLFNNVQNEVLLAVDSSYDALVNILIDMSLISKSLDEFLISNPDSLVSCSSSDVALLSQVHSRLSVLEESFV